MWKSLKSAFGFENLEVTENGDQAEEKAPANEQERKGLFATLKSMVGKDITSLVSMPIWVFEPMSFLQIMAEPFQFEELLQQAARAPSSAERLIYLVAFNAALYSQASRTKKPFNPVLGETMELVEDGKYRFFAEQVSHHPPVSIGHAESEWYDVILETHVATKFYGNSAEAIITGTNHFWTKKGDREHITWNHIRSVANNVIIGSFWVDHFGELVITNHTSGDYAKIEFKKAGMFGSGRFEFKGNVYNKQGEALYLVTGKWCEFCTAQKLENNAPVGEPIQLWQNAHTERNIPNNKFNWSQFNFEKINQIDPAYDAILAPSDSRLRADRRALQEGNNELAGKRKHEIEEEQRALRRERAAKGEEWKPRYFEHDPSNDVWHFNGQYWIERDQRLAKK